MSSKPYAVTREPLIWAATGGPFEFRVEVTLCGVPRRGDCDYFDETMKLASGVLRRAAEDNRFKGFDGIEMKG